MSYPKMKDCPNCKKPDHLSVYNYDYSAKHVECDACWYLGPAANSITGAIKLHNEKRL